MTPETTINIALIFAIVSAVGTIVGIISTIRRQNENENKKALEIEKNFVKVNYKLDEFCDTSRSLMRNIEKADETLKEVSEELVRHSERIETLFRKSKDHEERLKLLENDR